MDGLKEKQKVHGSCSVADVALWSGDGWVKRDGGRQSLDPSPEHAGLAEPPGP